MKVLKTNSHHHHTPARHHAHRSKLKRSHINPATLVAQAHDPFLYAAFGNLEPYYVKMQELFNRFMRQDLTSSCAQAMGTVIPWCLCPASSFTGFITNIAKQILFGAAAGSIPAASLTLLSKLTLPPNPEEVNEYEKRTLEKIGQQGRQYLKKTCASTAAIAIKAACEEWMCTNIFDVFKESFTHLFPGKDVFLAVSIATSIFFGMSHFNNYGLMKFKIGQTLMTSGLGFMYGMLREKVGFLSAAVAHTMNNLLAARYLQPLLLKHQPTT